MKKLTNNVSFRPRLVDTLQNYSSGLFFADLAAGLTVGIVALSLSMALGIASLGENPRAPAIGIYTAIIAGFLISAFGGTRVQIGGPTAAFIPIVVGVLAAHGFDNMLICTLMAGVFLILMGVARMGAMIKYIPIPVVAGFTAGIAVYIFSTQIKDFLGMTVSDVPAHFVEKLVYLSKHLDTVHWPSFAVAAASFAFIKLWPAKWGKRVPASIVAVIVGTIVVKMLNLNLETIASRFGATAIPQSLPMPHVPEIDLGTLKDLVRPALTIAVLAAIESLLCAVVADGMIEDRHDSNQELMGQGIANIGSALFGGLPATGAIARTATNIRSGAKTPVAGIIHSVTILAVVLVAAPVAGYIPLAVLSAVLVNVALNMGEWHYFGRLRTWPKSDAIVYVLTFILTVLTDITIAVEVGMVLAAVLFIKRISQTTQITAVDERVIDYAPQDSLIGKEVPKGVLVYQLFGAFMFGAADKLEAALRRAQQDPKVLILGMKRVMAMDATGLKALEDLHAQLRRRGKWLVISGAHTQPLLAMQNDGLVERIGAENLCENVDTSLERARQILSDPGKHAVSPPTEHH